MFLFFYEFEDLFCYFLYSTLIIFLKININLGLSINQHPVGSLTLFDADLGVAFRKGRLYNTAFKKPFHSSNFFRSNQMLICFIRLFSGVIQSAFSFQNIGRALQQRFKFVKSREEDR